MPGHKALARPAEQHGLPDSNPQQAVIAGGWVSQVIGNGTGRIFAARDKQVGDGRIHIFSGRA